MAQYQSFPDASGDSRTLEKLKALSLPSLEGRRFLDVGCNEGFFCGYAAFEGATAAVGLDRSEAFLERARRRFPDCEFVHQGWDRLPPGPFDVILLASALHYADDQPGLVHALMSRLSADGVLVLELGIASAPASEWVKVQRGIDEREFPSMAKVREVLADYAWKWIGPSVPQDGDPVARHVLHISHKRPVAYLLMQPPAFGKTTIAKSLFGAAQLPVVSGDAVIEQVAKGKREAPETLRSLLCEHYSPFRLDEVIRTVFDAGNGPDLVRLWLQEAGKGDFAVDAYVPQPWHEQVRETLLAAGYLPVSLSWERVGASMPSAAGVTRRAEDYFRSLHAGTASDAGARRSASGKAQGSVDDMDIIGNRLTVRGWAVDERGQAQRYLSIRVGGREHLLETFERQARPDVQRHLGLAQQLVGYVASVPVAEAADIGRLAKGFELRAGNERRRLGAPLPLAGPLAQKLAGRQRQ